MFGFKKILKELIELRKEVNELKQYSKPVPVKREKRVSISKKSKVKTVKRGQIDVSKIEAERRYPTDITVEQLAKKMHIKKNTLNNRLNYLKYAGERWVNDKRHVYYVDVKGRIRPEKYLSLYAQNKLFERYGNGYIDGYGHTEKEKK